MCCVYLKMLPKLFGLNTYEERNLKKKINVSQTPAFFTLSYYK